MSTRPRFNATEKKPKVSYVKFKTLDLTKEKYFKVYEDDDVGFDQLKNLQKNGQENIIDTHQDDDVDTDEEVFNSGV